MKKLLLFVLAFLVLSCGKISYSSLQGSWQVISIQSQRVTATTDSGFQDHGYLHALFCTGETLVFKKSVIIPCPTADNSLEDFEDYKGEIPYTISGGKLIVPMVVYTSHTINEYGESEFKSVSYNELTCDVTIDDGNMILTSSMERKDNLGNVKERVNAIVKLKRI